MSKKRKKSRFGANVGDDVERRAKSGSAYGYLNLPKGLNMFKVESDDRIKLDIIPYIVSDKHHMNGHPDKPDSALVGNAWYKRPFYVHNQVGVDNDSVVCPKTIKKPCPICEQREEQLAGGMEWKDPSLVKKNSLRNLYLVIPKDHKDYDEKIHLWNYSQFLFQEQLDEELKENTDYWIFPDPEDGLTLKIRWKEKSIGSGKKAGKFYETNRIDFKDRDEQYDEDIMEKYDLDEDMLSILSYKELENMFLEIEDDPDEDKKEDKPRRKRKDDKKSKEECPKDHKYGKDWDQWDDCDDCKLFDKCGEQNDS